MDIEHLKISEDLLRAGLEEQPDNYEAYSCKEKKDMIRLGVIGHGDRISNVIKFCLREVGQDIRVVGIVDPDETKAHSRLAECDKKDVRFYKNLKEMVSKAKLDALAIGTLCNLHAPYAIESAEYDIPLYLEKPVAISMEQATALEHAFEKSRCHVVVSFPLRVSPLCVLCRQQRY